MTATYQIPNWIGTLYGGRDSVPAPVDGREMGDRRAPVARPAPATRLTDLTPRQREVLGLVASGLSNKEIAACLSISYATVRNTMTAVYARIGVQRRRAASRWYQEHVN